MQKIRYGLSLDGQRGWHVRDTLGEPTLGPLGLLSLLELHLGLVRRELSRAERVVQLRECLQSARTEQRFYRRSFEADPLGTASTLLGWRDLWYLHGWSGDFPGSPTQRLRDMAQIEAIASTRVAAGVGQRLADIARTLQEGARPQVASIAVIDPPDELPLMWRRVLEYLPTTNESGAGLQPGAPTGTMLRALQDALCRADAGERPPAIPFRDDGSLRLVQAESQTAAAHWLANEIRASDPRECLVVAEHAGAILDAALSASDQPRLGLADATAFRPTLQVVPLALRLLWAPLDIGVLLQFLTLPIAPLARFVRRRIAEKIAAAPGVGGERWEAMITKLDAERREGQPSVVPQIRYWIENDRFKPADQAPLAVVRERTDQLVTFFGDRLQDPDEFRRAGIRIGFEQATAVLRSLDALIAQGVERIAPEMLDTLIEQATSRGSENPALQAQAFAAAAVTDPIAAIESFDRVHWWYLAAPALPAPYPWSPSEIAALRASGAKLPAVDRLLERQARGWLAPVLRARERLSLVLPRENEEAHPVWLLIRAVVADPVVRHAETVLSATPEAGTGPVPHQPLPTRRRWWQIPAGTLDMSNARLSYTSLEQLLQNPYQYVLANPARLRSSALLSVPEEFQLLGNLSHRVVEQLYRTPNALAWPAGGVRNWFEGRVDGIVAEEGATLLMPGMRAELERFRIKALEAVLALHAVLQGSGVVEVNPEQRLDADTAMGPVGGICDIGIRFAQGDEAVIDLKWAGSKKYREKLASGTHIQLTLYAKLRQMDRGRWPAVAYFILRDRQFLALENVSFPSASVVQAPTDVTAELWKQLVVTWAWRKEQLERGAVELVFDSPEPDTQSEPPAGAMEITPLDPQYNPFVNLAGWVGV